MVTDSHAINPTFFEAAHDTLQDFDAVSQLDRTIQIHGGMGLSRELAPELMFRDPPSRLITEGASEMQRIIVASEGVTAPAGRSTRPPADSSRRPGRAGS